MKNVRIYTNGVCLFTLENYGKTAGVCHVNGITLHSEVSHLKAMAMHSNGRLFYVSGAGDRKNLKGLSMRRGQEIQGFKIN